MACLRLIDRITDRGAADQVDLYLVEKSTTLGAGVAYGTTDDGHLLNMRAATMTLDLDRPDDFVTWLGDKLGPKGAETGDAYIPRWLFARYLRHRLNEGLEKGARAGLGITVLTGTVTDCDLRDGRVVLQASQPLPPFDYVVLCPGDLPSTHYQEFRLHPRYINSPWQEGGLSALPTTARVGILGAGLTAVDVLISLEAQGHRNEAVCFSRRYPFPTVQPRTYTPHTSRYLTQQRLGQQTDGYRRHLGLAEVVALFRAELEQELGTTIAWEQILRGPQGDPLEGLRADIARAEAGAVRWYEVLDTTAGLVPHLWHQMRYEAKTEFLDRYHGLWNHYRHPMPLVNAIRMAAFGASGRLRMVPRIKAVNANTRGGFDVWYQDPWHQGTAQIRSEAVDYLINATGTGLNAWLLDSALIRNMLRRGLLRAHPLGGIDVDFGTLRVRCEDGQLCDQVFFLGPLTRGVHFYTNSIETNLTNASNLSAHLASALTEPVLV